ncbi:MAG: hypothetical protein DMF62_13190 [Acidobacteria bacterium]|nr:MAG: hypothetical protein DMF62_13190 [Acidobacteriota bacterium]
MDSKNAQTGSLKPLESARILLTQVIDYAGLFPPSQCSMSEAVLNFATYRNSNYGWMLGRFVLPAARLDEFGETAREFVSREGKPWQLAVIAGEDINDTLKRIASFNASNAPSIVCDVLEVRANTASKIENTVKALPHGLTAYFEIGMGDAFVDLVTALAMLEQRAKIRTGGVTREEFPESRDIIRFVRTCMAANVPFKATAGLHHPIRCFKPLTYAENAPQGTMHGFLNMLMMTGFARESFRAPVLEEIMEEEFEEVFAFTETGVTWRGEHFLSNAHLQRLRTKGMNAFGSCSFDEPVDDLQELGLL